MTQPTQPVEACGSGIGECKVQIMYLEWDMQPLLFCAVNDDGRRFISVLIDGDGDDAVYRFAPISEVRLADLEAGRVDLHSVFRHCEAGHAFDVRWRFVEDGWTVVECAEVRCEDMTADTLPKPGRFVKMVVPHVG